MILFIFIISNILVSKCSDYVTSYNFKDVTVSSGTDGDVVSGVSFQDQLLSVLIVHFFPTTVSSFISVNTFAHPFRVAMASDYTIVYILQTNEPEQTGPLIDNRYTSGYFSGIGVSSPVTSYFNNSILRPYSLLVTQDYNNLVISADNLYIYDITAPAFPSLMLTIKLNGTTEIDVTSITNSITITTYDLDNNVLGYIYITTPSYIYTLNIININIRDISNCGFGDFATVNYMDSITLYDSGVSGSVSIYQGTTSNTPNSLSCYASSGTEYIYINFMPGNSTSIMLFKNQGSGTSFCYYNLNYNTDVLAPGIYSGVVHATQIGGPYVVIDTLNDNCASSIGNSDVLGLSKTIWIIIGCSIGGFCLLLICCGICFKEDSSGTSYAKRIVWVPFEV